MTAMETVRAETDSADTESANHHESLVGTNKLILSQFEIVVNTLTGTQYSQSPRENTSAVGAHVRHVIEFYQALLRHVEGILEGCKNTGALSYDKRQRNPVLEASRDAALEELNTINELLFNLPKNDPDFEMASVVEPGAPMISMRTTLRRELLYLLDHATHHMAIIRNIAEKHHVTIDKQFGLAQSTKAYINARG